MNLNVTVRKYLFGNSIFLSLLVLISISFGLIGGCGGSSGDSSGGKGTSFNLKFKDVTLASGFNYSHGFLSALPANEPQLISGGVASGDYNNDGWVDLYVVRGPVGPDLLFKNLGNGTFEEVSESAGIDLSGRVGSGPTFADIDGDGFLDLLVGGVQETDIVVLHNNGDGTFEDISEDSGITAQNNFSAAFGDYDVDGDLDLFLTHWINGTTPQGESSEHLWRNNGDSTFTDVSLASGIAQSYFGRRDFTFTPIFADINNDRFPDLLITGDFGTSKIFINQQNSTFIDTTNSVITDENGMGAAVGDYDNDGDLDWFVSSIFDDDGVSEGNWGVTGNRLYRNKGDGSFEDVTIQAGVEHGYWGWGSCFSDFNNDGYLDLLHVNGFGNPNTVKAVQFIFDPTRLFMSNGDGTFTETAVELGLDDKGQGRGVVCFDYDRDGDIDIFIANNNQPPKFYRNDGGNENNFVNIKLNGLSPNTEGIGARLKITTGGKSQIREIQCGSNFVSQNPAVAHFGLGDNEVIDEIRVSWLDGQTTILNNVDANQFLVIDQP